MSFLNKNFTDFGYYVKGQKTIENVYINGQKVVCLSATDVVPNFIKDNYEFFSFGKFDMKYARDKAKYILKSIT